MMIEGDLVEHALEKGLHDGSNGLSYSLPLIRGISEEVGDAYNGAYWHALAYVINPLAETGEE